MKKQRTQQTVRLKTVVESSDDDDDDITSASSVSNGNETDQSSKIKTLMRENERKIRSLSESYMNRYLSVGHHLHSLPEISSTVSVPSTIRIVTQGRPTNMVAETILTLPPALNSFIETLKQLIIKEEKKREKSYLPSDDHSTSSDPYTRLSTGITQCLRDYEAEINHAKRRINDLNEQQEYSLNENKHVVSQLTDAFEQNTISLRQTYEKHLTKQREESLKINQSLDTYKVEILTLRDGYEKKLRGKDELLNELNEKLIKNETEQVSRQHALHLKIEQFQQSFETLQTRSKQSEQNNQIKTKENHDLQGQISSLQIQIQRLQQTVTSKANECSELSQKLAILLPKSAECECFESELKQWFSLISPENHTSNLTLDAMSSLVSSKISHFERSKKQLDLIIEDLNIAHIPDGNQLSDRIRHVINQNKQMETTHNDINNKYQALLLQVNMLTGIIKQHSAEVANHKTNEEQLKDFNEQLLNENQKLKVDLQDYRSKFLQTTNTKNQLEHEFSLNKQHSRNLQVQYETFKAENQLLSNEVQTKRETMKHYEQELQSMKHLLDITVKEKQTQHERQLIQTDNDTLKQFATRDTYEKQSTQLIRDTSQHLSKKTYPEKTPINPEIYGISKSYSYQNNYRFLPFNNREEDTDDIIARRATSTPTLKENDIQPFGITKQIDQVLNDMKCLLTHGREVIIKQEDTLPERDLILQKRNKSRSSRKERSTVIGIEQN